MPVLCKNSSALKATIYVGLAGKKENKGGRRGRKLRVNRKAVGDIRVHWYIG